MSLNEGWFVCGRDYFIRGVRGSVISCFPNLDISIRLWSVLRVSLVTRALRVSSFASNPVTFHTSQRRRRKSGQFAWPLYQDRCHRQISSQKNLYFCFFFLHRILNKVLLLDKSTYALNTSPFFFYSWVSNKYVDILAARNFPKNI